MEKVTKNKIVLQKNNIKNGIVITYNVDNDEVEINVNGINVIKVYEVLSAVKLKLLDYSEKNLKINNKNIE